MKPFLQIIFFLLLTATTTSFAQNATLWGTVTDANNQEPLVGVNVVDNVSKHVVSTDADGQYTLVVPSGKHQITFSYVGYQTTVQEINLTENQNLKIDVQLKSQQTQLDEVVVSASQYEKRIAEETVSIEVIKNTLIRNTNSQDLSDVVERIPGVNIVDGQASIRGGSGYAYGSGSRVQVIVDDLPLITGDFGEVRWDFVPVESIDQVEVIKGASSVLYGSSALNGIINVRTSTARSEPETRLVMQKGVYFNPRNEKIKWWTPAEQPNFTGFSITNRQKIKNMDLVLGVNGYLNDSYLMYGDQQQIRLYGKLRFHPPKKPNLNYGVNINSMAQKYGRFFLWAAADTAAYEPFDGDSYDRYFLTTIDPYINYTSPKGLQHKLRTRYYTIVRYDGDMAPSIVSNTFYLDYQLQKRFESGLTITGGVVSNLFGGWTTLYDNNNAIIWTYGYGLYTQVEQKLGKVSVVGGLRYEKNTIDKLVDTLQASLPLVGRLGLNWEMGKNTFLRASFGQGYRAPSLVERFINADLSGIINVFANPSVLPERGWNAEIGIKQGFKFARNWQGYFDGALFWTEYSNMTEFVFTRIGTDIGFQTRNVTGARIAGWDLSTSGSGKINKNLELNFTGGYTFAYPGDLETDSTQKKFNVYMENLFKSVNNVDSLQNSILKYRFRNTARLDAQLSYKQKLSFGITLNYNSPMDKIDEVFLVVIRGMREYREKHNGPTLITDLRLVWNADKQNTLSIIGKNIFNIEYTMRPGLMDAPANIALQYTMKL